MVTASFDPFLPTAAELAGEEPAAGENDSTASERQARKHRIARRKQQCN